MVSLEEANMRGYKHMDPRLAGEFGTGSSIQIGTFEYYRNMEGERADPLEGSVEYKVDRLQLSQAHLPEYAEARQLFGLPKDGIRPGQHFVFQDNVVRFHLPPSYIFCCSSIPDEKLIAEGQAVFEIDAVDLFAHRLTKALNGILVSAMVGVVQYEHRSINPFDSPILDHNPFKKSVRFSHENEIRIVWQAIQAEEKFLRIAAPRIAPLLKRIA